MIKRLLSPTTVFVFALLLGLGAGPAWCWYRTAPLIARTLAARHRVVAEEEGKREEQRAHGWDFWTIEMENLTSELKEEKARVHQQEDELEKRAVRLAAERKELDRVRTDIEAMREEIGRRVIVIKADEAKNLRSLAQTYANLSPKAAVAIIRELDDTTTVKILSLMKPDVVGPIFEEMASTPTPDGTLARRAAALSEKIRLKKSGAPVAAN